MSYSIKEIVDIYLSVSGITIITYAHNQKSQLI
jgi:hypothetical protein